MQKDQGERELAAMKEQMQRLWKDTDRVIAKEVERGIGGAQEFCGSKAPSPAKRS